MPTFRSKPVEFEAYQWTGPGMHPAPGVYTSGSQYTAVEWSKRRYFVLNQHGHREYLSPGDWIITEPGGIGRRVCKSDIFEQAYELVGQETLTE